MGQWWFEWHDTVLRTAGTWLAAGAVLGLAFAGIVAVAERGRAVHQLRMSRLAAWGAAAGLLFALAGLASVLVGRSLNLQLLIAGLSGLPLILVTLLGAACAGLTVWLAGRGTPPPGQGTLSGGTDARAALAPDPQVPMVGTHSGADALTRR